MLTSIVDNLPALQAISTLVSPLFGAGVIALVWKLFSKSQENLKTKYEAELATCKTQIQQIKVEMESVSVVKARDTIKAFQEYAQSIEGLLKESSLEVEEQAKIIEKIKDKSLLEKVEIARVSANMQDQLWDSYLGYTRDEATRQGYLMIDVPPESIEGDIGRVLTEKGKQMVADVAEAIELAIIQQLDEEVSTARGLVLPHNRIISRVGIERLFKEAIREDVVVDIIVVCTAVYADIHRREILSQYKKALNSE